MKNEMIVQFSTNPGRIALTRVTDHEQFKERLHSFGSTTKLASCRLVSTAFPMNEYLTMLDFQN